MFPSINDKKSREFSESLSETGPGSSRTIVANCRSTGFSNGADGIQYKARTIDIWALGITIVIGGQYFNWNTGLTAGFGSYATGIILIGTAYICLCFCTSELSSALPFAGNISQTTSPESKYCTDCVLISFNSSNLFDWRWWLRSGSCNTRLLFWIYGWMLRNYRVHNLYSWHLSVHQQLSREVNGHQWDAFSFNLACLLCVSGHRLLYWWEAILESQ